MGAANLEQLAAKLGRPAHALAGLARLTPAQLAELDQALDDASLRQGREIAQALRKALPGPLRALLLRGLRQPAR